MVFMYVCYIMHCALKFLFVILIFCNFSICHRYTLVPQLNQYFGVLRAPVSSWVNFAFPGHNNIVQLKNCLKTLN